MTVGHNPRVRITFGMGKNFVHQVLFPRFFISVPLSGPRTTVIVHTQLLSDPTVLQEYRTVQKRCVSLGVYYLHPSPKLLTFL